MPICLAIKATGGRCTNQCNEADTRCKMHLTMITKHGKHTIELDELTHFHSYEKKKIMAAAIQYFNTIIALYNGIVWQNSRRLKEIYRIYIRIPNILITTHNNELNTLLVRHQNEIYQKLNINAMPIISIVRAPIINIFPEDLDAEIHAESRHLQTVNVAQQINIVAGELGILANDKQNIHTTRIVNDTKLIIDKVLKIPVPAEYSTNTLITIGEIILECKLSKYAVWQMTAKYCADEVIYEYPAGIYARLLNSVWQYIKGSPDKEDLKKILRSEMEDNIGMCAQGNLSRLCNILSGYLDGLVIETSGEKLQRLMAELFKQSISSDEKLIAGKKILDNLNVDKDSWNAWLEALL